MKKNKRYINPYKKIFLSLLYICTFLKTSFSFKSKSTFKSKSQSLLSGQISFQNFRTNKAPDRVPLYNSHNDNKNNNSNKEDSLQSNQRKQNSLSDFDFGMDPFMDNTRTPASTNNLEDQLELSKQSLKRSVTTNEIPVLSFKSMNEYETETRQNWKNKIMSNTKTAYTQQALKPPKKKAMLLDPDANQIIKAGWMKISSVKFANRLNFPEMTQDCGKMVRLTLDSDYYLMNLDNKDTELESLANTEMKYYFYFRLTKLNLYFTIAKDERHILGAILLMSINSIDVNLKYSNEEFCFKLNDLDLKFWILCAIDSKEKLEWVCKIYEIIGKISTLCVKAGNDNTIEITIDEPMIIVPYPTRFCNDNWNYLKQGDDWECECSEGAFQSPIDLPHPDMTIPTMIKPVFRYEKIKIIAEETNEETLMVSGENIKLRFKEDLIKLLYYKIGEVMTQDKIAYQAQEIQFHLPAEHTIMGKRYDMEMQIIHNGENDGTGKQLILSFLFIKSPGIKNLFFEELEYFNLPNRITPEKDIIHQIFLPKIFYSEVNGKDSYQFKDFSFYTYEGSLTNPPCAESTVLYVAADPIPLSSLTINLFKEAMDHTNINGSHDEDDVAYRENNFIPNYRKTQNLNGREIFYYDCKEFCVQEITEEKINEGHYEKLSVDAYQYFYVDSPKPSGIPDSYVVPPNEVQSLIVEVASNNQSK